MDGRVISSSALYPDNFISALQKRTRPEERSRRKREDHIRSAAQSDNMSLRQQQYFLCVSAPFILRAAGGKAAAPGIRADDNDTPLIQQADG